MHPPSFPFCFVVDLLPSSNQRVKLHYGEDVSDTSSLKQIFCSNIGYKGCPTPLKEVRGVDG